MDTMTRYAGIFAAWQLGPPEEIVQLTGGTINTIVRATIDGRQYFLRHYRHPKRAPGEHAVITHARARGFPAIAPLPLPDGTTILGRASEYYALFPQARGRQYSRSQLTPALLAAMGANLATLHRALRDMPQNDVPRRIVACDRDTTLARISRLEMVIARRDGADRRDQIALGQLAGRRDWLVRQTGLAAIDPTILDEQPIHGDYQETNLFFDGDTVCAVIDWDNTYLASRAWEIVRVLDYVCGFAPTLSQPFLTAYRADAPLPLDNLDRAVGAYSLMRAHDLWLFEEYFLAGNERVGQFITPGKFVPIADHWVVLRHQITD